MVDDPFTFGQIAAANALSDIYAMGAEPALALNILGFPSCLPQEVMEEILNGGASKVQEAGAVIAGGHSIQDAEPKYGLCVTGFIHPAALWRNSTAKKGDVLLLTKPLGNGITNTAAKAGLLEGSLFAPTIDAMTTLNKYARDAAVSVGIHACTDITGFGLLGHACEMAKGSGKTIELFADALPLLPYALDMAEKEMTPGGAGRNRDFFGARALIGGGVSLPVQDILFDPQTSGGLLFSVAEQDADTLLARLKAVCPQTAVVGRVVERGETPCAWCPDDIAVSVQNGQL